MSRCLVVGCDSLGTRLSLFRELFSVDEVIHWNGRSASPPEKLPKGTRVVVIYSGFVNHPFMYAVRKLAKKSGVRTVFLRRGLSEMAAGRGAWA